METPLDGLIAFMLLDGVITVKYHEGDITVGVAQKRR
jgi:hypothetical protein